MEYRTEIAGQATADIYIRARQLRAEAAARGFRALRRWLSARLHALAPSRTKQAA